MHETKINMYYARNVIYNKDEPILLAFHPYDKMPEKIEVKEG